MTPRYWKRAVRELSGRDEVLAQLTTRFRGLAMGSRGDAFSTLARAIVGQQISVKAAQSVWERVSVCISAMTPSAMLQAEPEQLRSCGLSQRKTDYLLDLAARLDAGTLDPARWPALDDETVIAELTQVKGIGRWTAEMFLIFHLARPDVLPLADLGLQRAMRLHYNGGRKLSESRMRRIGAAWAPWRSVATWYLWRSLDPIPVEY